MTDEQKSGSAETPPSSTPPSTPPTQWLPPRLRDRLAMADEPPPPAENPWLGWLAMLVIAAIVAGLVYWKIQSNKAEARAVAAKAAADRAAAVADSLHRVAVLDSMKAVVRADSAAAFLKLPAWKQALTISTKGDTAAATVMAAAEEPGHFVIDAGSFLFTDPANAEVARIKAATKLPAAVVPIPGEGNTTTYHVYVGNYEVRGAATYDAKRLFDSGKLTQATVLKLDQ